MLGPLMDFNIYPTLQVGIDLKIFSRARLLIWYFRTRRLLTRFKVPSLIIKPDMFHHLGTKLNSIYITAWPHLVKYSTYQLSGYLLINYYYPSVS